MTDVNDPFQCRQQCVKDVILPYRHANHVAHESEELKMRKCIAESITNSQGPTQDIVNNCTHRAYGDRIKIMSEVL